MDLFGLAEQIDSGLPEIKSKREYKQHCKQAMAKLRAWAFNGWVSMRYVLETERGFALNSFEERLVLIGDGIESQKCAVGLAFFAPDGQLYAGGSVCSPLDEWNRHIGQWKAVRSSVAIPRHVVWALAAMDEESATYAFDTNIGRAHMREIDPPYDFLVRQERLCVHPLPPKKRLLCAYCGRPLWKDQFPLRARLAVWSAIKSLEWSRMTKVDREQHLQQAWEEAKAVVTEKQNETAVAVA